MWQKTSSSGSDKPAVKTLNPAVSTVTKCLTAELSVGSSVALKEVELWEASSIEGNQAQLNFNKSTLKQVEGIILQDSGYPTSNSGETQDLQQSKRGSLYWIKNMNLRVQSCITF